MIADHPAQVGQDPAQIVPGGSLRPIGPQQPGQNLATMGPAGLDRQVSQ